DPFRRARSGHAAGARRADGRPLSAGAARGGSRGCAQRLVHRVCTGPDRRLYRLAGRVDARCHVCGTHELPANRDQRCRSAAVIEVAELHKVYGRTVAVRAVTFTAPNGQVTGLLGTNGGGKTTPLRAITGSSGPGCGRATIDGYDPRRDAAAARSRLGVLPEAVGLYDR